MLPLSSVFISRLSSAKKCFAVCAALLGIFFTALQAHAAANPGHSTKELRVVATIAPLHSIATAVMEGVAVPQLLLKGTVSPHHYALTPQDALLIREAHLLFTISTQNFETFLQPETARHNGRQDAPLLVEAMEAKGLVLRRNREDMENNEKARVSERDPHIWLDPHAGQLITQMFADAMAKLDPAHRDIYQDNAKRYIAQLDDVKKEIEAILPPKGNRHAQYIAQHPAYSYFENAFGISASLTLSPLAESSASAKRVAQILTLNKTHPVRCMLHEPQLPRQMVEKIASENGAEIVEVDPLGTDLAADASQYPTLLRRIAKTLAACIGPAPQLSTISTGEEP